MRNLIRTLLALGVLVAGVLLFAGLVATRPEAQKVAAPERRPLVEVQTVSVTRHPARVEASGVVLPSRQVQVSAEVGGRVVWMHPELVPGGRAAANTRLLRIDARDYRLALEQQAAQVDRARTDLELERGRKRIAEREWKLLNRPGQAAAAAPAAPAETPEGGNLALREPQLRSAQAALRSAESGLQQARLAVGKTGLVVPFNALVQSRAVDIGQLVAPGAPIATLVGTDSFWVQVSIPVGRLARVDVPGLRGASQGSPARIRQRTGEGVVERPGRVVRMLGDLDPAGRMARLLVEIDDPLALRPGSSGAPLLLGAYVGVEIDGRELDDVVELARAALRDDDSVYLVGPGDALVIRQVEVVWRQRDHVLVGEGLAAGDRVIVSPLSAPVAGMKIKVAEKQAAPPAAAGTGGGADRARPAPGVRAEGG